MLEKALYMSPGLISRWTKTTPALDRILEIANYFQVSIDTLVGNIDERNDDNVVINQLLSILYNKSLFSDITWQIFNSNDDNEELITKKISSVVKPNSMDCFYCNFNGGCFILTIIYDDGKKELSFYVLANSNSYPDLQCVHNERKNIRNEKLYELGHYLLKRYSKDLNRIKTENFINDFISQENDRLSNDKFTVIQGNAVNE